MTQNDSAKPADLTAKVTKQKLRPEIQENCSRYYDDNEKLEQEFKVKELVRNFTGVLFMTNYKFQFVPVRTVQEDETGFFMVPFGYIEAIKESKDTIIKAMEIAVFTKDEREFKFKFENDSQF